MKLIQWIAIAALTSTLAITAVAKETHSHDHKPLHGGLVVEVKDIDYELVAKADSIQLYLRDHDKKIDISKATAKVTLLTGKEKQEAELKPVGDKLEARLEAKGTFNVAAKTKAVAVVNVAGKVYTARFVLK